LSATVFFCVGSIVLWQARAIPLHVNGVLTRAEGIESKANATLINIDTGTKVWAASAKSQTAAIEDLATDAHGSLSQIDLTLAALRSNSDALNAELAEFKGTTQAATGGVQALTADLTALQQPISASQALLARATGTVSDLDTLLKQNAITDTLDNVSGTSAHLELITGDLQKVSDKLTNDFVAPKPWWKKIGPSLSDLYDYGALVARHAP
jgi:chromosome segregation ATPase